MKIDGNITNHQPVELRPLADILGDLKRSGRPKAMIFLGQAKYKDKDSKSDHDDGPHHNHGWVSWRPSQGGIFTDPFDDTVFFEKDLDIENSKARTLQPGEVLNIHYYGE